MNCIHCKRDDVDFPVRRKYGKIVVVKVCLECKRLYDRNWHKKRASSVEHIANKRKWMRKTQAKGRSIILESKGNKPCKDCGLHFPSYCMEYDHVNDDKVNNVANMITSPGRLLEEIAKCELVCSNCHRIRTFSRKQSQPIANKESL